ncbi:hypothetical protein I3842_15G127300 [Carya illinoinensis]|uniref:Uncharacterized protein n=1 Tax=Carya illinoinensis TaxID=32201 RepID=A0A922A8G4_CARIL|nr:hypothetical protein I3842_15G127300 [Carya illinoinensis]
MDNPMRLVLKFTVTVLLILVALTAKGMSKPSYNYMPPCCRFEPLCCTRV